MSLNNIQNLDIVKSEGQDKSHLRKRRYLPSIVGTTRHELTESSLDLFQENTLPESRQMSTDRSVPNSITTLSTSSSILELSSHSVLKKDVTIENLLPPEITNPIQKSPQVVNRFKKSGIVITKIPKPKPVIEILKNISIIDLTISPIVEIEEKQQIKKEKKTEIKKVAKLVEPELVEYAEACSSPQVLSHLVNPSDLHLFEDFSDIDPEPKVSNKRKKKGFYFWSQTSLIRTFLHTKISTWVNLTGLTRFHCSQYGGKEKF